MMGDAFTLTLLALLGPAGTALLVVAALAIKRRIERHERANDVAHVVNPADVAATQLEVDLLIGLAEINDERLRVNAEFDRILGRAS